MRCLPAIFTEASNKTVAFAHATARRLLFAGILLTALEQGNAQSPDSPTEPVNSIRWDPSQPPAADIVPPGDQAYLDFLSQTHIQTSEPELFPGAGVLSTPGSARMVWTLAAGCMGVVLLLLYAWFPFPGTKPRWPLVAGALIILGTYTFG